MNVPSISIVLAVAGLAAWTTSAGGYELLTHARLAEQAFDVSENLRAYLEDIGVAATDVFDPDRDLHDPERSAAESIGFMGDLQTNDGTLRGWFAAGAIREDDFPKNRLLELLGCAPSLNPPTAIARPLNHLFDVQRGGRGLTLPLVGEIGFPAPDWALGLRGRGPGPTENQFSVLDARQYQLTSLVAGTRRDRDRSTARLFRALGQVMHLLQDTGQPQHTRNDPHAGCLQLIGGGEHSWYELYVETRAKGTRFLSRSEAGRPLLLSGAGPGRFSAYREHWINERGSGLAELSSRNFLSAGTNFGSLCGGLLEPTCDPAGAEYDTDVVLVERTSPTGQVLSGTVEFIRRQIQDPLTGQAIVVPDSITQETTDRIRVSSRSLWDQHLLTLGRPGSRPKFSLNVFNYDETADALLPRIVGHSAGLLDYFLRGRLDVDVVNDEQDPALVRVRGTNRSPETLDGGTLTLHVEGLDGVRRAATPAAPAPAVTAEPNGPVESGTFEVPADSERFVVVYRGTLGREQPGADPQRDPGAVIGKVLGGVRVEEIFAGDQSWHVRTPKGVFALPLAVADYDDVRWGDGDDLLVARTPFDFETGSLTIRAFQVARAASSLDFQTVDTGAPIERLVLTELRTATVPSTAPPVVSRMRFTQTVNFRQLLGRMNPRQTIGTWKPLPPFGPNDGFYDVQVELAPLSFEIAHEEPVVFVEDFAIALDPEHNHDVGDTLNPYSWQLIDVGLTRDHRLLGLVEVFFGDPVSPARQVPLFGLSGLSESAEPIQVAEERVTPFFPFEVAPVLWAVVDLVAGTVVASTADPEIVIAHEFAREAAPWKTAVSGTAPIFAFSTTRYIGGPRAGDVVDGWIPLQLRAPSLPIVARTDVDVPGGLRLDVTGWMRPELRRALEPRGLLDFSTTRTPLTSERIYDCAAPDACHAVTMHLLRDAFRRTPLQLLDAVRARPAPGPDRVVFLGFDFDTGGAELVAWDPGVGAQVRLSLRDGISNLMPPVAAGAALVGFTESDALADRRAGGYLVPLDGDAAPTFLKGNFLFASPFALVDPSYLYNRNDLKFYRPSPLQRTALPATLKAVDGNPRGDYHAVRLP